MEADASAGLVEAAESWSGNHALSAAIRFSSVQDIDTSQIPLVLLSICRVQKIVLLFLGSRPEIQHDFPEFQG